MVQPAIAFKSVLANANHNVLPLESANEECAGEGKPRVRHRRDARLHGACFVQRFLEKVLRRADAEVRIVGDLQRSLAGPFGKAAVDVRLHAPGDSPKQELLVIGTALSPKTSGYLSLSWPTVMWRSPSICSRRAVVLIVSSSHGVNPQ